MKTNNYRFILLLMFTLSNLCCSYFKRDVEKDSINASIFIKQDTSNYNITIQETNNIESGIMLYLQYECLLVNPSQVCMTVINYDLLEMPLNSASYNIDYYGNRDGLYDCKAENKIELPMVIKPGEYLKLKIKHGVEISDKLFSIIKEAFPERDKIMSKDLFLMIRDHHLLKELFLMDYMFSLKLSDNTIINKVINSDTDDFSIPH
jgi:hypothetical protein